MRLPTPAEAACGLATSLLSIVLAPPVFSAFAAMAAGLPALLVLVGVHLLSRSFARLLQSSLRLALPRPHPGPHAPRPLPTAEARSRRPKASIGNRS